MKQTEIEEICAEICDMYCKYSADRITEEDELNKHCERCPLNRLHSKKKPIHTVNATKHDVYTCECGELLRVEAKGTFKGRKVNYCRNCGQAIDWGEE